MADRELLPIEDRLTPLEAMQILAIRDYIDRQEDDNAASALLHLFDHELTKLYPWEALEKRAHLAATPIEQDTRAGGAPPLTDEQIDRVLGAAYRRLVIDTGYTGGMGGESWDRAAARAIEAEVRALCAGGALSGVQHPPALPRVKVFLPDGDSRNSTIRWMETDPDGMIRVCIDVTHAVEGTIVDSARCGLCEQGFPLEGPMHYGTQALGMIQATRCAGGALSAAGQQSQQGLVHQAVSTSGEVHSGQAPANAPSVEGSAALRDALERVIGATHSHIDGRDLLAELHPRRMLDIKRRRDGVETWFQGDWLSNLWDAVKGAKRVLDGQPFDLPRSPASAACSSDDCAGQEAGGSQAQGATTVSPLITGPGRIDKDTQHD
jgi:hypothetical protein